MCQVTSVLSTLCNPVDCSPPGSSVHGIIQERILEVDCHDLLQGIFWPRGQTWVFCGSCIPDSFFTAKPPGKPQFLRLYNGNKILRSQWGSVTLCEKVSSMVYKNHSINVSFPFHILKYNCMSLLPFGGKSSLSYYQKNYRTTGKSLYQPLWKFQLMSHRCGNFSAWVVCVSTDMVCVLTRRFVKTRFFIF